MVPTLSPQHLRGAHGAHTKPIWSPRRPQSQHGAHGTHTESTAPHRVYATHGAHPEPTAPTRSPRGVHDAHTEPTMPSQSPWCPHGTHRALNYSVWTSVLVPPHNAVTGKNLCGPQSRAKPPRWQERKRLFTPPVCGVFTLSYPHLHKPQHVWPEADQNSPYSCGWGLSPR